MFLGFTLAVISIHGSQKNVTAVAVLVPLLLVGYPLLDTSLAVVRRLNSIRSDANGRGIGYVARNAHRVFLPDRGHLHHLLLDLGVSHRRAVLSLYACALAFAIGAFVLVVSNSLAVGLVVAGTLAGLTLLFIAFVIARARVARRRESQPAVGVAERPRGPVASGGVSGGP
jgi:UDP-GlcNAc:undecaprenyl-phosphate GlcNAc-1-phosphate transferase